ncbi:ribonuclease BN [Leptobacterium flavescens]|uniref:Ribonuclease BN n=1 Tax=Leptobacterium flavescens TaxID=472055 RepID=A0A6P0UFA1_9FLAO|nr:YihY/virulence factor BrkB family protein [Leptobacterium flavescens]NER11951.1 ribonuclease BN [Leptobacterium flavescens]
MSAEIEARLEKVPGINILVKLLKKIKLKAFVSLSLYDLIEMYVIGIAKGAVSFRASAIAFSLFMALFPLLLFLLNLIPFVPVEGFDREFLAFLEAFLPSATSDYFETIYGDINKQGGLLSSSFLLSIFFIANGINAIFSSFENSYHVELTRNFFRQYLYAIFIGLILALLLILACVGFIYFEIYVVQYMSELAEKTTGMDVSSGDELGVRIGKVLFLAMITYLFTAILYYFGVVEGKKARFFSSGALLTTILILITTYLFGIYVDNFARYNELYGTIGGLLILMIYIWLNSNILLLGFELNASLNKLKNKA